MGLEIFYKLFCAVIFKSLLNMRLLSPRNSRRNLKSDTTRSLQEKRSVTAVPYESLLS